MGKEKGNKREKRGEEMAVWRRRKVGEMKVKK